jgi:glycosyltransferase involved in cell wall biosynthesis
MEAIACGTPAVAFPVGGLTDMVRPGITGWLANESSPEELAETIDSAIEDMRQGVKLQDSCRDVAKAEYSSELQAKRYIELFESL